jgi:hypothetical protein
VIELGAGSTTCGVGVGQGADALLEPSARCSTRHQTKLVRRSNARRDTRAGSGRRVRVLAMPGDLLAHAGA